VCVTHITTIAIQIKRKTNTSILKGQKRGDKPSSLPFPSLLFVAFSSCTPPESSLQLRRDLLKTNKNTNKAPQTKTKPIMNKPNERLTNNNQQATNQTRHENVYTHHLQPQRETQTQSPKQPQTTKPTTKHHTYHAFQCFQSIHNPSTPAFFSPPISTKEHRCPTLQRNLYES
jgi:hypothetical protein